VWRPPPSPSVPQVGLDHVSRTPHRASGPVTHVEQARAHRRAPRDRCVRSGDGRTPGSCHTAARIWARRRRRRSCSWSCRSRTCAAPGARTACTRPRGTRSSTGAHRSLSAPPAPMRRIVMVQFRHAPVVISGGGLAEESCFTACPGDTQPSTWERLGSATSTRALGVLQASLSEEGSGASGGDKRHTLQERHTWR